MTNKLLSYSSLGIQLLIVVLVGFLVFGGSSAFGAYNTTNYGQLDTEDGYSVDGTSVINGSGVWTGAITSSGAVSLSGSVALTGSFNPYSIGSGVLSSSGATSSPTAAQLCAVNVWDYTATDATASATLPGAVSLQAACLNTIGGYRLLKVRNLGTSTTTIQIAAGASSTLEYNIAYAAASTTIVGGNSAVLVLYSATSTTSDSSMVVGDINFYQ